jgi:calcium-dependent protein kinase
MKKTSSHLKDYSKLKDSQLLGQGAFGKVYKVVCKKTQDIRAMKVLDKDKITASSQSELINEIEILKKLDHPNILKVYEYYEDARHLYIVTEFVDGRDLLDEIYE